eukprot:PLAT6149.1.p1 GENE.PLAT6149.1~~PLAT6149.1.p1  ORF type:complete len:1776 (-),score=760.69 PLAT6149.1:5141-10468(-)
MDVPRLSVTAPAGSMSIESPRRSSRSRDRMRAIAAGRPSSRSFSTGGSSIVDAMVSLSPVPSPRAASRRSFSSLPPKSPSSSSPLSAGTLSPASSGSLSPRSHSRRASEAEWGKVGHSTVAASRFLATHRRSSSLPLIPTGEDDGASGSSDGGYRINVGVRVRPLLAREVGEECWEPRADDREIAEINAEGMLEAPKKYDHVFGPATSNREVYAKLAYPLVESCLQGYNATLFAYGQTASGKTHTLMGEEGREPGVIELAIADLFDLVREKEDTAFSVQMSYLEIYNEEVIDLLAKSRRPAGLKVFDDAVRGPMVHGLVQVEVHSTEEVLALLGHGAGKRHFGAHLMNEHSSRSHTMFQLFIKGVHKGGLTRFSTLHLVDLAGSERSSKTGATGIRLKEGVSINKSLLSLGNIMAALSRGKSREGVSFRESKLTRLLSTSLGGNAQTAIVCNISPAATNRQESRSTLLFASRAMKVTNHAHENSVTADAAELLAAYEAENKELLRQLQALQERGGVTVAEDGSIVESLELADLRSQLEALRRENEELRAQLAASHDERERLLHDLQLQQEQAEEEIEVLQSSLHDLQQACDELRHKERTSDAASARAEERQAALKRDVDRMTSELADRDVELQTVRSEAEAVREEFEDTKRSLRREAERVTADLHARERALASQEAATNRLADELKAVRNEAATARADSSEMSTRLAGREEELRAAKAELYNKDKALISARDELARARRRAEDGEMMLRRELSSAEDKLDLAARSEDSMRAAMAESKSRIAALQRDKERLEKEVARLSKAAGDAEADCRRREQQLQQQLDEAVRQLEAAQLAEGEAVAAVSSLQSRVKETESRLRAAEASHGDASAKLDAAEELLQTRDSELAESRRQVEDSRQQLQEVRSEQEAAARRLAEAEARCEQASRAAAGHDAAKAKLTSELEELRKEALQIDADRRAAEDERDRRSAELEAAKRERDEAVESVRKAVKATGEERGRVEAAAAQVAAAEGRAEEAEAAAEAVRHQLLALGEERDELTGALEKAKLDGALAVDDCKRAEDRVEELTGELQLLRSQQAQLQAKMDRAAHEKELASTLAEDRRLKLELTASELRRAEDELITLRAAVDDGAERDRERAKLAGEAELLRSQRAAAVTRSERLEQLVSGLRASLSTVEAREAQLQSQAGRLTGEVSHLRQKLAESGELPAGREEELLGRLTGLEAAVAEQQQQLDAAGEEAADLRRRLERSRAELSAAQHALAAARDATAEREALHDQLQTLAAENATLSSRCERLRAASDRLAVLTEEREAASRAKGEAEAGYAVLQDTVEKLRSQLTSERLSRVALQQRFHNTELQLEAATAAAVEHEQLESALMASSERVRQLRDSLHELQAEAVQLRTARDSARADAEAERARLQAEVEALRAGREEALASVSRLASSKWSEHGLRAQLEAAVAAAASADRRREVAESSWAAAQADLQAQLDALRDKLLSAQAELERLQVAERAWKEERTSMTDTLTQLRRQLKQQLEVAEEESLRACELDRTLRATKAEARVTTAELAASRHSRSSSRVELHSRAEEVTRLRSELATTRSELRIARLLSLQRGGDGVSSAGLGLHRELDALQEQLQASKQQQRRLTSLLRAAEDGGARRDAEHDVSARRLADVQARLRSAEEELRSYRQLDVYSLSLSRAMDGQPTAVEGAEAVEAVGSVGVDSASEDGASLSGIPVLVDFEIDSTGGDGSWHGEADGGGGVGRRGGAAADDDGDGDRHSVRLTAADLE